MRLPIAALAGACMLAAGCTVTVDGSAVAPNNAGPLNQDPIPVSALETLLLDVDEIDKALGATSMELWFGTDEMWDWSDSVADKNCLAIDGPAQAEVYADTGWTAVRGQRLDDSIDDSQDREHYAIQAVVAFPSARAAAAFYRTSVQSWNACSNRRFFDVNPGESDTVWNVAAVTNDNGTLGVSQVQEDGDGWSCQRALTVRNNISIDIVTCDYDPTSSGARDIAEQIAARVTQR